MTTDFSLGAQALPAEKAGAHFDRYWRLKGKPRAELTGEEAKAYDQARAAYVALCSKQLHASPQKQETRRQRAAAEDAWATKELAAGRQVWGISPPESIYLAAGVPTPKPAASPPTRPREPGAPGRQRRGDATSRGGSSDDPPRPSSSDLARPARAPRPGGAW